MFNENATKPETKTHLFCSVELAPFLLFYSEVTDQSFTANINMPGIIGIK